MRMAVQAYLNGRRMPFLSLYHALHTDTSEIARIARANDASLTLRDCSLAPVRELARLRDQAAAELLGTTPDTDGVVRIAPSRVHELTGHWPRSPSSVGVFCQLLPESHLVVNDVWSGYGRGVGRVQLQAGLPASPRPAGDVLYAEFDHLAGTSLNSRVSGLSHGIDYPGAVPHRPADRLIPLGELEVRGDPARLWWARRGVEVRPVHTGTAAEFFLPPAMQFLVNAFGETPALLDRGHRLHERARTAVPRLQVGRVVLRRARWTARPPAGSPDR